MASWRARQIACRLLGALEVRQWVYTKEKGWVIDMDVVAKAHSVQLGKAKTGSPQIAVEFYILSKGRLEGRMAVWYGSLIGGATEISTKALAIMGWNGNLKELHTAKKNNVRLSVVIEGENDSKLSVKGVYPKDRELVKDKLSSSEVDSLQAMLNAFAPESQRQREPGDDDEDLRQFDEDR